MLYWSSTSRIYSHPSQLYRVYVLYGKRWTIIAAPLVLWTAFLGTPSQRVFSPLTY
jgi:hypothetical protein